MSDQLQRSDVSAHEKWDLTHIYADTSQWEEDYDRAQALSKEIEAFQDNIHDAAGLLAFLKLNEDLSFVYEKLFVYASLKQDEDTRVTEAQAFVDKARSLGVTIKSATSFFRPFLLSMEKETLDRYIEEEQGLDYFKKDLYEEFKYKPHVLSKEKEEVLSQLGEVMSVPKTVFGMINNADIQFGEVTDENGKKVTLTRGMYSRILESHNRERRAEAFKAYYKPYVGLKNTIAATLGASAKNNVLFSKMRNYESPLQRSLFADNVPVSVYENLIQTTRDHLAPMYRYVDYRKKRLGLDELRVYDLSVPLVEDFELVKPYEEAYDTVLAGLAPLGEEYISILKQAKTSGWIDVRETQGKRSGAYCWGPYGTHPYVLLNHNNTLDSMFTLAHEMGHALHSYLSDANQPKISAQYTIFVAEVASTVNEVLLIHHLLNNTADAKLKRYLVNHFIDTIKGTFFTQVMFAEFEKIVHEKAMRGEALTADSFSETYESLFRTYNGEQVVLDPELKYGWSRIPHFYNAFYVYKYATGIASAISIATRILDGDQETVQSYLTFLKSGGSEYPLELLRNTGVDLLTPEPITDLLSLFDRLVGELETT
ncbi:oligoendopeptidase F [Paenibacillus allorhizosphaerae]|uniref:Oligopeptidase F n=1 Tax=Paenibacillus allorhizosphaerae TaxID=2849866 RepID=A0ABM8VHX7_9BACL|nr:oligoendopeptidase F [Paenibacillus allorhizosphaerae]CAG7643129.1 Oligoendopeptidase F, plasmid [Paenibacillus allorhizosphaerae]